MWHNASNYRRARACIPRVGLHRRLPAGSKFDLDVVGVAQHDEGTPAPSMNVLNTRMRHSERVEAIPGLDKLIHSRLDATYTRLTAALAREAEGARP
jgi:hypothetical protein